MPEHKINPMELARFSRITALLFNRVTTYSVSHPYSREVIDQFHQAVEQALEQVSPLVLLMAQNQLSIDEEPLDPRINVNRILAHFKKTGIQSVSFEKGLDKNELRTFLEVFTSVHKYPTSEAMKRALETKGVRYIRVNHVFFKKVTADDEIVALDLLKKLTPQMEEDTQKESRRLLIDVVLQKVLAEELAESLTVESLMKSPGVLSKNLIETDLAGSHADVSGELRPGHVLIHQLERLDQQLEDNVVGDKESNLIEIAEALFEMKRQLVQGVAVQKAADVVYANEEAILVKIDSMTDRVLTQIVKDEYKAGATGISRLAQILRRLIPDGAELRRLLPQIKAALLDEGMTLPEYLTLLQELATELQSEELSKILQESAEQIGVDGQTLIQEFKANPSQAAELILLAAEIRKGDGDQKVLTDLLVETVEKMGSKLAVDIAGQDRAKGEGQLHQIVSSIESSIVDRLRKMDIQDDLIQRLEEKFSSRINELVDKVKLEWIRSVSSERGEEKGKSLSLLQMMEQTVSESTELGEVLEAIRLKAESGEIDENDFGQLYSEIITEQQRRAEEHQNLKLPIMVLRDDLLTFFVEKEVARARRYLTPLSALGYSLVKAKLTDKAPLEGGISPRTLMNAMYLRISKLLRNADVIGDLGANKILVLLPMTSPLGARSALQRSLKLIHSSPLDANGIPINVTVAGVMTCLDPSFKGDARAFLRVLLADLAHMETRIRNLQAYF